jgi:hypothetical protein
LILKGVKVVCFDTLLQVLILKEVKDLSVMGEKGDRMNLRSAMVGTLQPETPKGVYPTPRFLAKEAASC